MAARRNARGPGRDKERGAETKKQRESNAAQSAIFLGHIWRGMWNSREKEKYEKMEVLVCCGDETFGTPFRGWTADP